MNGHRRAQSIVRAFRPRIGRSDVVVTGFGSFPGVPRNATADIVRELAALGGFALRVVSHRSRDFAVGRGALALPSGREARASLMILPVAWDAAGALVEKEARATRARLVVMCGVAAPSQPIFVEADATSARVAKVDALGVRPRRARSMAVTRAATLEVELARGAIDRALTAEPVASVPGVLVTRARPDNAYVCNATAYAVATARLRAAHGFLHWPKDISREDVPACARVLGAMIDVLLAARGASRDPLRRAP